MHGRQAYPRHDRCVRAARRLEISSSRPSHHSGRGGEEAHRPRTRASFSASRECRRWRIRACPRTRATPR
ncbi:hypothetical protein ACFFX0_19035 [Citricoccus parietis]|uniref:Uncharacterized protein n=1 Tax=Citricoccus parietis TaxID=592307 RepID=A0ABV5G2L2_9MICC